MPRLIPDVRHAKATWWKVDDRNHLRFDVSNLRHDPFDEAKVEYARTLFPSVLPEGAKLVGFDGNRTG